MALKVWLPLNKSTKNFGLFNSRPIPNNVELSTNGVFNNCYKFSNNTNSYINANVKTVDLFEDNDSYSVTFWVKLSAYPSTTPGGIFGSNKYISEQTTGNYKGGGFGVLIYSNYISIIHANSTTNQSKQVNNIPLNTWLHIAICYNNNGNIVRCYVNGEKQLETTFTINYSTNGSDFIVGRNSQGGCTNPSEKYINDFRIYDHCISESDVKRIYLSKTYEVVEGDNMLFERCGLSTGGTQEYNLTYNPGIIKFNGNNGALKVPFNNLQKGTFSMNVWFFRKDFGSDRWETIFGGPSGFELESKPASSSTCNIVAYSWGGNSASKYIPYTLNEWNMLTMTRTTGNTKFYLNGALKYTGSAGSVPTGDYFIGAWSNYNGQNFKGNVSKFSIYSKELSASEIQFLYDNEKGHILPDDYIQLEYIQSTGTQYIDTGINGFNSGDWEIYCEWMSVAAPAQSYGYIFGVYEGENYNSYRLIHKTTSTTEYYVSAKSKAGGGSILLSNVALNTKHSIKIKNGTFTCDGVSYTASTTGTSLPSANTMLLFKSKNNLYSKCRIYSTWAKKDGILKYNMIPAKRKSDNIIGMYDMVSRQFFTNSGTGSFTGA